jgi:hypothetical protein
MPPTATKREAQQLHDDLLHRANSGEYRSQAILTYKSQLWRDCPLCMSASLNRNTRHTRFNLSNDPLRKQIRGGTDEPFVGDAPVQDNAIAQDIEYAFFASGHFPEAPGRGVLREESVVRQGPSIHGGRQKCLLKMTPCAIPSGTERFFVTN